MTDQHCACPVPFTEDDLICAECERREQESYERVYADQIPTGSAWAEYARRQG